MNHQNNLIAENIRRLRLYLGLSQEAVAEKIGVTRQAVAKWEKGETLPDVVSCDKLAALYGITLDDLVRSGPDASGLAPPPRGKHLFGTVRLGERGQFVIPKAARDMMKLKVGDTLVVLGDSDPAHGGLALMRSDMFLNMVGMATDYIIPSGEEEDA